MYLYIYTYIYIYLSIYLYHRATRGDRAVVGAGGVDPCLGLRGLLQLVTHGPRRLFRPCFALWGLGFVVWRTLSHERGTPVGETKSTKTALENAFAGQNGVRPASIWMSAWSSRRLAPRRERWGGRSQRERTKRQGASKGRALRVQGAGCRVQGAGCRVQGAGCRVQGVGRRVQGAGRRVQGAGCRV